MQSLIRSKSAGVTGGRGTAGAGPGRDLLYQSHTPLALPVKKNKKESPLYVSAYKPRLYGL